MHHITDEQFDFAADSYDSIRSEIVMAIRSEIVMDWQEDQRREQDIEALQTTAIGRGYAAEPLAGRHDQEDDSQTEPAID